MTRANSFNALTAAVLTLAASLAACAPAVDRGSAMAVTRGLAIVPSNGIAENNSDDAQATGNPLAVQTPTVR